MIFKAQKSNFIFFLLYFSIISSALAVIPLSSSPSWTSIDNDFSTGGGFADIDNDGYIDFCTSNGNDMALNKQGIYYNNSGILQTQASWRSSDSGMFGHLYLGDVNNDGLMDMAVAYLGPQGDCKTRIYQNTGICLSYLPTWISSDTDSSFDCTLGDIDLDGDLDLAVSAGDAYSNRNSPVKIYRNNNGVFENLPYWSANDSTPSDAIRFADLNQDGYLDLIVGYRRKISVFYNQSGNIEPIASWSINENGWVIRIATADYDNDGWIDVVAAINGQLSGDSSRIKVYRNNQGQLNTTPSFRMLRNTTYCSCVIWADFNNDGYLDLSAGGWWEPVVVFENRNGILDTIPTWSWNGSSNLVCEVLVAGDVRNFHLVTKSDTFSGNGFKKLFYSKKSPIQKLINITVNQIPLTNNNYCYDPLTGWVSLASAPSVNDTIIIKYQHSTHPDLAVTNWTSSIGNYIFYNTTPQQVAESYIAAQPSRRLILASPNPFTSQIKLQVPYQPNSMIRIYNSSGQMIKSFDAQSSRHTQYCSFIWNGRDASENEVVPGIYFVKTETGNSVLTQKIVKLTNR